MARGHIEHRLAFEWLQALVANLLDETGRADVRALRDAALRGMSLPEAHAQLTVKKKLTDVPEDFEFFPAFPQALE